MADDLYQLLGLSRGADADEIKRAYRRLAREHHPDAGGEEETFKRLTHAYEVLSDPQRRARYDRFGDDGTPSSHAGARDPFGFGGINDVIDAFFGSAFGGGGGGGQRRRSAGRDVLVGVDVDMADLVDGVRRDVEVEVAIVCDECGGSGSADGSGAGRCRDCGGAGQVQQVVRTAFGQVAAAAPCPSCQGSGRAIDNPCTACAGEGRRAQRRTVTVDVPAGVEDGDKLRVAGGGEAGRHGAPAGDLFVEVRVAPHPVYERDGRDLLAAIVVPVTQAALGGSVTVPDLAGDDVDVPVPAGTQPGDVLVVRKHGLPVRGGGRRGDLKLVVDVEVPTRLDREQRELLERLAEVRGDHLASSGSGLFARMRRS